jgi:hypothetical protein
MQSYLESANPQTGSSPAVNTQSTIPQSSGSYVIDAGKSACIWTTRFSIPKTIPEGKMTLDIWAGPTPCIDGKASATYSAASGSVTLTTTQPNDLIYVLVSARGESDVSVSGAGLSWNLRGSSASGEIGKLWAFYAISPYKLTSAAITAQRQAAQEFAIVAFGISGANTSAPFDANLANPKTASGTGADASASFESASKNDLLIGALLVNNNQTATSNPDFRVIDCLGSSNVSGAAVYMDASAVGAHTLSYQLSPGSAWAMIGDAIVPQEASEGISVSAYTTTGSGEQTSMLFSDQKTNQLFASGSQVATTFPVAQSNIPSQGYIKVVLTAPATCAINIEWGAKTPTNLQIELSYG